jgi:hypothetical protein
MSFGTQRSAKNRRATRQFDACATDTPTSSTRSISLYGSASVHFLAPTTDSVSAAMQILDAANSLNFISQFHPPDRMDAAQHTFDGLLWRRDAGVTGFLGLANRTSESVQV